MPAESPRGILAGPPKCLAFGGVVRDINFMFYVYVLIGRDKESRDKLYTGFTEDLIKRMRKHKAGEVRTTKGFKDIELIYYEACLNKTDARKRELQLKTGFGRGYVRRRLETYFKLRD